MSELGHWIRPPKALRLLLERAEKEARDRPGPKIPNPPVAEEKRT